MKRILTIINLLIVHTLNCQTITTIVGNGESGFAGDGGLATQAKIKSPSGVTVDKNSNLYFCGDYRVRRVALSDGLINTIAGNGIGWFSGDGGPSVNATFDLPTSIISDSVGNLYIGDGQNRRIRKIDANTGIISTIAGNGNQGFYGNGILAIYAAISPIDICLDATETNLYIADGSNNRIRKIDLKTGIITTVAGFGPSGYTGDGGIATSARLNVPTGIFVDSFNNIYIADMGNNRIRKIDGITKIITTIAGSSHIGGYSGDGALAINARLWYPTDVAIDKTGNIYIVDNLNNRIRFISIVDGNIHTLTGNGVPAYSGDGGPAENASINRPGKLFIDKNQNLYFTDRENHRIRKIDLKSASLIYTFIGSGNYDILENWKDSKIPPSILPPNAEIIINHTYGGECILNVSQTISENAKFTILNEKKLVIKGNLLINN